MDAAAGARSVRRWSLAAAIVRRRGDGPRGGAGWGAAVALGSLVAAGLARLRAAVAAEGARRSAIPVGGPRLAVDARLLGNGGRRRRAARVARGRAAARGRRLGRDLDRAGRRSASPLRHWCLASRIRSSCRCSSPASPGSRRRSRARAARWSWLPPLVAAALVIFPLAWMLYDGMGRRRVAGSDDPGRAGAHRRVAGARGGCAAIASAARRGGGRRGARRRRRRARAARVHRRCPAAALAGALPRHRRRRNPLGGGLDGDPAAADARVQDDARALPMGPGPRSLDGFRASSRGAAAGAHARGGDLVGERRARPRPPALAARGADRRPLRAWRPPRGGPRRGRRGAVAAAGRNATSGRPSRT